MALRKATVATLNLGPAIQTSDGVTAITAGTFTVTLSKAGAAYAARSHTAAATHDAAGWWRVPLNTNDTATGGPLIARGVITGGLPVWARLNVLDADAYDALVAGTGNVRADVRALAGNTNAPVTLKTALESTGVLRANAVQIDSDASAATTLKTALEGTGSLRANVVRLAGNLTAANNQNQFFNGTGYAGGSTRLQVDMREIAGSVASISRLQLSASTIVPGTVNTSVNAHTPTTTEFQASDITTAAADHYNGRIVIFTSGTLKDQATDIVDYSLVGGIGQFQVTALTSAPVAGTTFIIV